MRSFTFLKTLFFLLGSSVIFVACKPDPIDPVSGKDSQLLLDSINFHQFYTADYLQGTTTLEFQVVPDSSSDTSIVRLVDSFNLKSPFNYKRTYDFDMPLGAQQCRIYLSILAKNGFADSVTIHNMVFKHNNQTHLNKALSSEKMELGTGTLFNFPMQTVAF